MQGFRNFELGRSVENPPKSMLGGPVENPPKSMLGGMVQKSA